MGPRREGNQYSQGLFGERLKEKFAPFTDVPIIFISVKEKTRIFKVIETAMEVYENRQRKIPTSELNDVMLKAIENYHPLWYAAIPIKLNLFPSYQYLFLHLRFSAIILMISKSRIEIISKTS